jgi:Amt family ammonium transporter
MQFCAVTAALVIGSTAERGRVVPAMVFIFCWATLVYCPLAYWAWGANGWAFQYGVLDYAGGGPVEIGSGVSALAYSWVLGRRNEKMMLNFRPHNISLITLGTILLWFGWLGFNGGSAFGANLRATMACWNSCLTAMFAAMTWCLLDFRLARKWSLVGWCSGTISGLVAATPAAGVITPWASIILGVVAGIACNFGTKIKFMIGIDDALDVFAEHAIGGIVGLLFNAFFAADYIIGLDGVNMGATGGFLNHNFRLLYIQVAYIVAACAYTFVMSALIAKAIDLVPGLHLRASSEAELLGMDDDQHGEFAYDYVEVCRLPHLTPFKINTNATTTGPPRLPRLDARREGPQRRRHRRHPATRHCRPPGPRRQRTDARPGEFQLGQGKQCACDAAAGARKGARGAGRRPCDSPGCQ